MKLSKYVEKMKIDLTKFCNQVECDSHINSPLVEAMIERLYNIGYINGADFVEWLKGYGRAYMVDKGDYIAVEISIPEKRLAEALQEYLKGE